MMPSIFSFYEKNHYQMGYFYLEDGHVEIHNTFATEEEFDF